MGAYAGLVFVLSVTPSGSGPAFPAVDKAAHLCLYLVFGWLLVQAMGTNRRQRAQPWRAWAAVTSYGVLMELMQAGLPWRSAELTDAMMNATGAALGVWVGVSLSRRLLVDRG